MPSAWVSHFGEPEEAVIWQGSVAGTQKDGSGSAGRACFPEREGLPGRSETWLVVSGAKHCRSWSGVPLLHG